MTSSTDTNPVTTPTPKKQNHLSKEMVAFIVAQKDDPKVKNTFSDIKKQLKERFGVDVSLTTISQKYHYQGWWLRPRPPKLSYEAYKILVDRGLTPSRKTWDLIKNNAKK